MGKLNVLYLLVVGSAICLYSATCSDVGFSIGKSCYSKGDNMTITANYTGSGNLVSVEWYYSGAANNLSVFVNRCPDLGTVPTGFPNISRLSMTCDATSKMYTLTVSDLQDKEIDSTWGATFTLIDENTPDIQTSSIKNCQSPSKVS